MPHPADRFSDPQPRLQRRRWHHVKPKQQQLLAQTEEKRRDRGTLYDYNILRPLKQSIDA